MKRFTLGAALLLFLLFGCSGQGIRLPDRMLEASGHSFGKPLAIAYSDGENLQLDISSMEFGLGEVKNASLEVSPCEGGLAAALGKAISERKPACAKASCLAAPYAQSGSHLRINASCGQPIAPSRGDVYIVLLKYATLQRGNSSFIVGSCEDKEDGTYCTNSYRFLLEKI